MDRTIGVASSGRGAGVRALAMVLGLFLVPLLVEAILPRLSLATTTTRPGPGSRSAIRDALANAFWIPFENVDGAILIKSSLIGEAQKDTSGTLILDTGAGFLALEPDLIRWLGLSEKMVGTLEFAPRPLPRLGIGTLQQDLVGPVLAVDVAIVEQAMDRRVLGLLGQQPLGSFAIRIDYRDDSLALIPMPRDGLTATTPRADRDSLATLAAARDASRRALGASLGPHANAVPFTLEGDGKIVVAVRVRRDGSTREEAPMTLIVDTGATKSVFFTSALADRRSGPPGKELHGLSAPTLYGSESAYLARLARISLANGAAFATDVDVAVMSSPLEHALGKAVRRPVHGLLGASFLRRFVVTIDYPHRILWLDPVRVIRDQRRYEYSHVGTQIERRAGEARVVAVATGSPAERAGVKIGDEIVAIDGAPVKDLDILAISRRLEGPPGTRVVLRIRREQGERDFRLTRRQLL